MDIIAGDWHFWPQEFSDYDIFKSLSSLKFNGIEIGIRKESDLTIERIIDLNGFSDRFNLPIKVLSCFFPPAMWKDRITAGRSVNNMEKAKKLVLKTFEAAEKLGAENIGIWLGADRIYRNDDFGRIWGRCRGFIIDVLMETERSGKNLILEYKPGEIVNNSDAFLRLADEVKNKRFGLLLDTGHAIMQGEDPAICVNKTINHLKHIHLDDNNCDYDADIVPGYYHNFKPFFNRLKVFGYSGSIGLDLYFSIDDNSLDPVLTLQSGRDYIRSME